ncbi:MAG: EamA family transporter, partial [Deltaproteobacteria bacterium]|nr:EamA family transporter [Deltaproteobacteria bacterium]
MNKTDQQQARYGYLYVCLAAVLFAISGTSSKFLFNTGITPGQLIQMRTTLAWAGLMIWLWLRQSDFLKISLRDLPYFFLLGVFGLGSAQFFYLFAISEISVAAAILLHYTGPAFVALYVVFIQRQKIGLISVLSILGALTGCFFVVEAYNLQLLALNRLGIISGLLAAVSFAVYSISSDYGMRKYSPYTVLLYGLLFAMLMWNLLHPPLEAFMHRYSPVQWGWILFIGILGTIIPFGLYFQGIKRIRPAHAS